MTIVIERKHEHFVGQVSGIDCRQAVTKEDGQLLNEALDQFGVLIFLKIQEEGFFGDYLLFAIHFCFAYNFHRI